MKSLSAQEMREVDRLTTERYGISQEALMEAAGKNVADRFLAQYGHSYAEPPGSIAVLCGRGNNGGDGFVVARYLKEEAARVQVYLLAHPSELKGEAGKNFRRWQDSGGGVTTVGSLGEWEKAWEEVRSAEVIIDALLGTGIRGAAEGLIARAIEDLNRLSKNAAAPCPAWIVAVDTPSGLPSDGESASGPVVRAHCTVTFTAPKIGQLVSREAGHCGQLIVCGIGSPPALVEEIGKGSLRWAGPEEFADLPLLRAAEAHKGSFGHVLLVAGSLGKTGAAVLAGQAALLGGSGLVTIATPESVLPIVAGAQAEYMTEGLPGTMAGAFARDAIAYLRYAEILRGKSVLAIGPGVGRQGGTQEFVRRVVSEAGWELPVVVDADGLNAFVGHTGEFCDRTAEFLAVTPHPGEMARLLGGTTEEVQRDRVQTAAEAAKWWNAHVILKGFHTIVASPRGEVFVNTTGSAALAKGGSGDVLTGLLASMIAQFGTEDFARVLALGVYLHGRAADLLAEQTDPSGVLAGEVAQAIPYARRRLLAELAGRD